MGGKVLDLPDFKVFREGKAEGLAEGLQMGEEKRQQMAEEIKEGEEKCKQMAEEIEARELLRLIEVGASCFNHYCVSYEYT